eukprot:Nitzschia sp. Nitz4//scaffold1_size375055//218831//219664//NITZ4_000289-RA/size375055-processed-gene-0.370-mRNA-1//1//CDS//3329541084//2943//frame0
MLRSLSFTHHNNNNFCPSSVQSPTSLQRQPTKWDLVEDDDDDDDVEKVKDTMDYTPTPPDMRYNPGNCKRSSENYMAIREVGGVDLVNDVYVREPGSEVCWYIGKVARVSGVSLEDCIARQWPIIERHAANLRPMDLFPCRGIMEILTADGDSEMEVAYNRPNIVFQNHVKRVFGNPDFPSHVKPSEVGFRGETYVGAEDGFRTWRNQDGTSARPEIDLNMTSQEQVSEEELQKVEEHLRNQGLVTKVKSVPTQQARLTAQKVDDGPQVNGDSDYFK